MTCMKCYPKMCRCPLSQEERIAALLLALSGVHWNEDEKRQLRAELSEILEADEIVTEIQKAISSGDYTDGEKEKLRELKTLVERTNKLIDALK